MAFVDSNFNKKTHNFRMIVRTLNVHFGDVNLSVTEPTYIYLYH